MLILVAPFLVLALGGIAFIAYVNLVRFPKQEIEPQHLSKLPTLLDLAECFPNINTSEVDEASFQRIKDSRIDLHYDAKYHGRQLVSIDRRLWIVNRSSAKLANLVERMAKGMNTLPSITAEPVHFAQDFAETAGAVWSRSKDGTESVTLVFANPDGALFLAFTEGPCTDPHVAFDLTRGAAERALVSS